jgi:hypothetical protein
LSVIALWSQKKAFFLAIAVPGEVCDLLLES